MSIREDFENREKTFMSPHGCLSSNSRGRLRQEEPCPIRTVFQRDRDRIIYSNAFRRLKHKTQVFLSPMGDHYRTRLTHTLEVAEIARTIARAMRLNEDLVEAIALGHDLGHTPFGHGGEVALKEIYSKSFSHNEQSLRVVDVLENNGKGLNLTREVRDGILKHSKGYGPMVCNDSKECAITVEGRILRVADIMAYLNHDFDDAIRSKVIRPDQIPESCLRVIGKTHSQRANTMIRDVIDSSRVVDGKLCILISDKLFAAMTELREFLYEKVYRSPQVHKEFIKAKKILSDLYNYLLKNDKMLKEKLEDMEMLAIYDSEQSKERVVCDLIASMTDRYALNLYEEIFFPMPIV